MSPEQIDQAARLLVNARRQHQKIRLPDTCRPKNEDEAYAILRKAAMDQGKRVADVAQALVTAAGLLG